MIKGFIEVHDVGNDNNATLVNIRHITEVSGNFVYMDDAISISTDFSHIRCKEDYEEIKQKIKEAVGDGDA
jgi:hypothetical protein